MRSKLKLLCFGLLQLTWLAASGCGDGNIFSCPSAIQGISCEEKSAAERAKDALDDNDPQTAIDILEAEIADAEDDDYSLYPLLAAAYARNAGVDLFNLTQNAGSGGSSLNDVLSTFLADPTEYTDEAYDELLNDLDHALELLLGIPSEYLEEEGHEAFASSVVFQKTLYYASYAFMILNQFVLPDPSNPGSLDQSQLESMSAEDVEAILSSLQRAATNGEGGDSAVGGQVDEMLEDIDQEEGADVREQLINYVQQRQGQS